MSTIDPRTIAAELIRTAASDIDAMGISEFIEGRDVDDPDGGITEQVDELIRAATITVDWPDTEQQYLIWSHHRAAWWGPNGGRYFYDITRAGRYTLGRAKDYASTRTWPTARQQPPEVVIPAPPIDVLADPERIGPWVDEQIKTATDAAVAARSQSTADA